jgi:hypothetical protein
MGIFGSINSGYWRSGAVAPVTVSDSSVSFPALAKTRPRVSQRAFTSSQALVALALSGALSIFSADGALSESWYRRAFPAVETITVRGPELQELDPADDPRDSDEEDRGENASDHESDGIQDLGSLVHKADAGMYGA